MRRQLSDMALMESSPTLTGWCQGEHRSGMLENLPILIQINQRLNGWSTCFGHLMFLLNLTTRTQDSPSPKLSNLSALADGKCMVTDALLEQDFFFFFFSKSKIL